MATPDNLLEQLVMQMRTPEDPNDARRDSVPRGQVAAPIEDEVLATLLYQALDRGEEVPPASELRPQLAGDLGLTEDELTQNLMGVGNLVRSGIAQEGSVLGALGQDHGLDRGTMRDVVRGNTSLANAKAGDAERRSQARESDVRASQNVPEPDSDSILQGLLAEARGVTERANPDAKAAFQNKLSRMMRSPEASPAERKAAYQLRHPDMTVEVQEDGIMSFSDKGPGLQVKDERTRKAVDNVKAQLETLSPDQPIVAGEGDELVALAATTKQRIADNVADTRTTLFGDSPSKAVSDIQNQLQSIVDMDDPTERAIAFQRMGPQIAAYGNQRRNELRSQVFSEMRVPELQRSLALQEQRDRTDPRWDEFRRDSPDTAAVRAQLRQAQSDATALVEQRLQTDPMLNTLSSQTNMAEALIKIKGKDDSELTLSDRVDALSPQQQGRIKTAAQAMNPGKDVSSLSSSDLAKMYAVDEPFYAAIASMDSPSKTIASVAQNPGSEKKLRAYLKQAELNAGADETTAEKLTSTYVNIANRASTMLANPQEESLLKGEGGEVRALVEQWLAEKGQLSPTELERRKNNYYMPRIVEAKLGYLQTQQLQDTDRTYDNLQPTTTHEGVNELLTQAKEKGYTLGDLMKPERVARLAASQPIEVSAQTTGRSFPTRAKVGIYGDKEARLALAKYISEARKSRMLQTAFMTPTDTTKSIERKLQVAAVTTIAPVGSDL